MIDYEIQANTRRCAATGRDLRPGERVYTVLVEEGGRFVRQDYSSEGWQEPPAAAFGFWVGRVPAEGERRRLHIDEDLMVDCFERLEGETEPSRLNFRYVVALLLMRRKRFKFVEVRTEDDQEVLHLRCARTRNHYRVVNPRLTDEEVNAVQEEVFKILGWG